jgi:hypothetical protein
VKCPECKNKAIGFVNWSKGTRWYRTQCDSCARDLKANRITILGFALCLIAATIAPIACYQQFAWATFTVLCLMSFAIYGLGTIVVWFGGGYVTVTAD